MKILSEIVSLEGSPHCILEAIQGWSPYQNSASELDLVLSARFVWLRFEWMTGYDLSDAVTETVAGALYRN